MKHSKILEDLLLAIPDVAGQLVHGSKLYSLLKSIARREVEMLFSGKDTTGVNFQPFGKLVFPYRSMGTIDSLNLFDLDELMIFGFYFKNRKKYRKVLDLGANIGLHSIILSKCGYDVTCYEPDPVHYGILRENFVLNEVGTVKSFNLAISTEPSEKKFIRVLGNTTGSHIAGAKANPYGALEYLTVKTIDFRSLVQGTDLIKMDIEGHEKDVLLTTTSKDWEKMDALAEIENAGNGKAIFEHFQRINVPIFAQKINWQRVRRPEDLPCGYREGSIFISYQDCMPW